MPCPCLSVCDSFAVIAALDELKKYDAGAREAIKYLESEFKRGNRFVLREPTRLTQTHKHKETVKR